MQRDSKATVRDHGSSSRGEGPDVSHQETFGEPYLTSDEVASRLHLTRGAVEGWRRKGVGPPFRRVGRGKKGKVLYLWSEVREWMDSNKVTPEASDDERP